MDPSLLHLFSEEWSSIRELPLMGTLRLRVVSERLFAHLTSPAKWGKAGVKFITSNDQMISGEVTPMVILVIDGMGEGSLGMVTTFCHHEQAKVEASEVFSALHQHDFQEPSVIAVKKLTNSLYLPWGSFSFLYPDVTTFFRGMSPNSHWTGYAYASYSLTLTLRWFCHGRRERKG